MWARIKPADITTKKQKEAIRQYVSEELEKQKSDTMRRLFKLFCASIHEEHGHGKYRLSRTLEKVTGFCNERENDPVFWAHIDKLMEQIGLEFQKEDYEEMGE
jgi:hypothetical protein